MVKKSNKRRMNESYGVYDLINYFDVWGNEEDGWDVNNVSRDETDIWIDDDTTDEELVDFLIDDVGFLSPSARGKVAVWNDGDMIEFEVKETGEPLCRLERTRTADGKAIGESRTRRTTKRPMVESKRDDIEYYVGILNDMYGIDESSPEILTIDSAYGKVRLVYEKQSTGSVHAITGYMQASALYEAVLGMVELKRLLG